ncbi:MAG TPA: tetratricopeptide repeat protein [Planctomycetota bacterium]|nr:tetratricopeptide repeat protein [Planctomycetota bacterium]
MPPFGAEDVYLFAHVAWRSLTYEELSPFEHARLHALALEIYERGLNIEDHPLDFATKAAEFAQHAQAARLVTPSNIEYELYLAKEESWAKVAASLIVPRAGAGESEGIPRTPGEALRAAARLKEAEAWYKEALGAADSSKPWQVAELLLGLAVVYMDTGRPADAQKILGQAAEHYRAWGNRRGQIVALTNLGTTHKQLGQVEAARRLYHEAEELQAEGGTLLTRGYLLVHQAVFYHETGRLTLARVAYLEALKALREVGDRRLEGMTLGALANLFRQIGYRARAEACYREALALHEAGRDARAAGIVLGNLASLFQDSGRLGESEDAYLRAIEADHECGNLRSEAIVRGNLAILYRETGRFAAANRMFMQSIDMLSQVQDKSIRAAFVAHRGVLCLLCGNIEGAEADAAEVLEYLTAEHFPTLRLQHALPLRFRLHVARALPLDLTEVDEARRERELAAARATLAEIQRLIREAGHTSLALTAKLVENCQAVLDEVAAAFSQWRPPLVFRGHLPSELNVKLRHALHAWLSDLDADLLDAMRWQNPELLQALMHGADRAESPDWTSLPEA